MGAWGEGSKDLHALIRVLGESKVSARGQARGEEGQEGELGFVMVQVRRILSCTFVRAQSLCLLARLGQVGPRARGAAERRAVVQRLEWARKREAEGHWLAHIRGRGLGHKGMFFIP